MPVAYGIEHGCATVGTSVRCFGENGRGQLGDGTTADTSGTSTPTAAPR